MPTTDLWLSPSQVAEEWADSPLESNPALERMIRSAQVQCIAYAPKLPEGTTPDDVPDHYKQALLLQVRSIGLSMIRDSDVVGMGDFGAIRIRPLAGDVKALLRPKHGKPKIG